MNFLKKNWSNLLLLLILALLIIPQTRKPFQVALNRMIAFSPSEVSEEDREVLGSYSWNLVDLEGNRVNFARSKGKVAVVNLWATWCPPCIAEMPSFQALYQDYGDKVDFYFISAEETGKLREFSRKKEYNLPMYVPASRAPSMLQSNALPTTYVISPTGEIVVNEKGAANWNDGRFRDLLDKLISEQGGRKS